MKAFGRVVAVAVAGSFAVAGLAGCVDTSPTKHTTSPTSPATSPNPTPTSSASATPVSLPCTTVLTAQQVYDYNPNYVAQDDYSPTAGSDAATVATDSGTVCGWVNETSGSTVSVAIAQPAPSDLAGMKSTAAGASSPVSVATGAVGFFSTVGGVGELQVFTSKYWVVIASSDFAVAGDVEPTAQVVIRNISAR
jgi:hypothetical protein